MLKLDDPFAKLSSVLQTSSIGNADGMVLIGLYHLHFAIYTQSKVMNYTKVVVFLNLGLY